MAKNNNWRKLLQSLNENLMADGCMVLVTENVINNTYSVNALVGTSYMNMASKVTAKKLPTTIKKTWTVIRDKINQ